MIFLNCARKFENLTFHHLDYTSAIMEIPEMIYWIIKSLILCYIYFYIFMFSLVLLLVYATFM